LTAIASAHALAEAVDTGTVTFLWLESALHRKISSLIYDYFLSGVARQILNAFPEHNSIKKGEMKQQLGIS
jgi:hypothetical protein